MPTTIHIPRMTDREIIRALNRMREALSKYHDFKIRLAIPHHRGDTTLPEENPEEYEAIQYALKENSAVIDGFHLISQAPERAVLKVIRNWSAPYDNAEIEDDGLVHPHMNSDVRESASQIRTLLLSLIRTDFKSTNLDASLSASDDSAWSRYRNAQVKVISSLEQAAETLLIKNSEKNAELDKARSERFEKLEADLREQLSKERKAFQDEFEAKTTELLEEKKLFAEKEAAFNTREARHVSRQVLDSQLKQINDWLQKWGLTEATSKKRQPIFWAYIAAIFVFGAVSGVAIYHNYLVLSKATDPSTITWWLWLVLLAKTIFPLAAFTTFVVYFIRWSSAWARQHADEEFRNRTRLIDIGRSSWLLEAVRDAQEKEHEIPADLLKELSRNLFANPQSGEADMHPQAITDTIMQGLSSIRVRSADGSEVEATRGSKKDK